MEFHVVSEADQNILSQAARLHHESLSYRSFITLFGEDFLKCIYEALLKDDLGFFVLAKEGDKLVGFVLAVVNSDKLMGSLVKRVHLFLPVMAKAFFKRPSIIKNIFETLFYSSREGTDIKPELLISAVQETHRSQGIGKQLVEKMEEAFIKRECRSYKVTVHKEMARSIQFYERNKMRFLKNFMLYGHTWSVYVKEL